MPYARVAPAKAKQGTRFSVHPANCFLLGSDDLHRDFRFEGLKDNGEQRFLVRNMMISAEAYPNNTVCASPCKACNSIRKVSLRNVR